MAKKTQTKSVKAKKTGTKSKSVKAKTQTKSVKTDTKSKSVKAKKTGTKSKAVKAKKTGTKSKSKNPQTADEKAVEAGKNALRRDYYASIDGMAKDILDEHAEYGGEIWDQIHQSADSSYWVTYTHANLDTLVASDNWDAVDEMGDFGMSGSFREHLPVAAFYAVRADLEERVARYAEERGIEMNPGSKRKRNPTKGLKNKLLR